MSVPPRIRIAAVALPCALLAGCLTRALWNWSDPDAVPLLAQNRTVCRVDQVLATDGGDPAQPDGYAVGFVPVAGDPAPAHLRAQAAHDGDAWLWVRPLIDFPARAAMPAFRARGFELDVFDGEHLRRRTNGVRMTVHGTVPPDAVGALLAPDEIPPRLRRARISDEEFVPWGPIRRTLEGIELQPWTTLLSPAGAWPPLGRPEAVAFVDADGTPVPAQVMAGALLAPEGTAGAHLAARGALLARVTEGTREVYVRIPVPVLLNAEALDLEREGDLVRFAWARRGVGRFVRRGALPDDLVAMGLPMVDRTLVYEWSREVTADSGLKPPLQVLLSPFTAILDFLVETSPPLRALRDWLFPPPDPVQRPVRNR